MCPTAFNFFLNRVLILSQFSHVLLAWLFSWVLGDYFGWLVGFLFRGLFWFWRFFVRFFFGGVVVIVFWFWLFGFYFSVCFLTQRRVRHVNSADL